MRKRRIVSVLLAAAIFSPGAGLAAKKCPPLKTVFESTLKKDPQAERIFSPIAGKVFAVGNHLCTAVFVSSTVPRIRSVITVDRDGKFGLPGLPVDLSKNREAVNVERVVRPLEDSVKRALREHSFTITEGDRTLYVVASPSCPFCQRLMFYFMDRKDLLKKADVSLRVIPAEHAPNDVEAFACLLEKKDSFLARFASRACLEGKEKTEKAPERLLERVKEAMDFGKKRLFIMGIPLVFDGEGNLVAQGFDPGRIEAYLERLARSRTENSKKDTQKTERKEERS